DSAEFPLWAVNIPLVNLPERVEYKLVKVTAKSRRVVAWERGDNRILDLSGFNREVAVRITLPPYADDMPGWRGAGVAIPVFSLRSEDDFGVGDFYDLKKLVDWAEKTGQRFIQILPVNDTTMTHSWSDSYPYNANSTFALHPMYLRLEELGRLNDKSQMAYYEEMRKELNALADVDYEAVNRLKTQYTREMFNQDGDNTLGSKDFADFMSDNSEWLMPYAAYCVLRDKYRTPDFHNWDVYADYDAKRIEAFGKANKKEIDFVCYQQYHLDRQLRHVREYAHSKGIAIKGDIPIGISRTSVDAWILPLLFNLDCQAGAPPDDFSVLGQNWGFPTYDWEEMSRDGFAWWKARFRKMAEYFDAYRIDHVLGFFRIWQIPMDAIHGLLGMFNPALPLTADEMISGYDFRMDVDLYTRPYVKGWMLSEVFGDLTDEAKAVYLSRIGDDSYRLRPEVDTQRKVAGVFAVMPKNEHNTRLCNGLLRLIDDVLFIEDPYEKSKYH
ncbi:MAG: 4-alpha-glucanotransferase, partial [Muribaculaceae bacterium]|nr:4-alpha-glucanotransferase [Muribaculaceae bacterium]